MDTPQKLIARKLEDVLREIKPKTIFLGISSVGNGENGKEMIKMIEKVNYNAKEVGASTTFFPFPIQGTIFGSFGPSGKNLDLIEKKYYGRMTQFDLGIYIIPTLIYGLRAKDTSECFGKLLGIKKEYYMTSLKDIEERKLEIKRLKEEKVPLPNKSIKTITKRLRDDLKLVIY